jgi:dipeptidase E
MRLVLYSGGQLRSNHKLHQAVVNLARQKSGKKVLSMTYIPFCSDNSSIFYHRAKRRFSANGVGKFFCLAVDHSPTAADIKKAFESDIIYLAGGNTFYFLKHLRDSGVLPLLKKFAKKGGVLAGLSAGALIMSPTVALAADKGLGPDDNDVKMKKFNSMGLFNFEFSPHYDGKPSEIRAHLAYSKKTRHPVYAVADGSGVVIDGKEILIYGNATIFHRGKMRAQFKVGRSF